MDHRSQMPVPWSARRGQDVLPFAVTLFVAVLLSLGRLAFAQADHTAGFARYARVDRADGTYREMLVDQPTLEAMQAQMPLPDGATILMESYYHPGEIGSIFAKRFERGRWLYGSFQPGEPLPVLTPSPQCAGCHRMAGAAQETFTLPMLVRFAQTGAVQQAGCNRSGRAPCEASIYSHR